MEKYKMFQTTNQINNNGNPSCSLAVPSVVLQDAGSPNGAHYHLGPLTGWPTKNASFPASFRETSMASPKKVEKIRILCKIRDDLLLSIFLGLT